jgi:hypothetical protein
MIHEEFYKLAGEYAKKHVDECLPKNMAKDKKETVQGNVLKHFINGGRTVFNLLGGDENTQDKNLTTLNVRLDIVSNGAIFTDLNCEDKYLGREVFVNENEDDESIFKELGSWLFVEIANMGLAGKNIELSIEVKEI